ncbi:MAG: monovalent cation:proton antiporter-2 (CPA2) family protein [Geminicoccaceae bacterium]|nr:monovalent cation:proton antiporter-2 (CPA2) family protein [Geminicoccaceae bacterium]
MEHEAQTAMFTGSLILLAAVVVAVPLFKRLGLGSVLGYLAAGIVIGPSVLGFFREPEAIMKVAELGVVLFLFIIGLELSLSTLWRMRRDIFGLGSVQIVVTGLVLALYPLLLTPYGWKASLVAGLGLALSSTAFVMQLLEERGELRLPHGQKAFAILLMQDLAIVPLLALVALLSPRGGEGGPLWLDALEMAGAVAAVILVGRYLLNPFFQGLARSGAKEVMTAAALLVVIGAATLMTYAGLSMALGAFLAGVMLAESNYRHELEADIEPFRGILLGLFFLSVGMSVDLAVVADQWLALLAALCTLVVLKALVVFAIVRVMGNDHDTSVRTSLMLAQGGEFGFVLYSTAVAAGVMEQRHATVLIALVTLSMATTPFLVRLGPRFLCDRDRPEREEDFSDADGEVLVIGFGRFGQLLVQVLLAGNVPLTILDSDPDRIEEAGRFGAKIFYGDGTRLDVLRAAGIAEARLVVVCTRLAEKSLRIVETVQEQYPDKPIFARAYDRRHALALMEKEVAGHVRDTAESAFRLGRDVLMGLGAEAEDAGAVEDEVRRRDAARLEDQRLGGILAGRDKYLVRPEPLYPRRGGGKAEEERIDAGEEG